VTADRPPATWRPSLELPLRFLRGRRVELALAVVALTIAVAFVCTVDLVNRATLVSFAEVIDRMAGRASLQVSAGEAGLFPEDVAATVARVSGVELAVPVVSATAFLADGRGELLTVLGVDITHEPTVRSYEPSGADRPGGGFGIEDPLVFLSQPDSIALTKTFADAHDLGLDGRIALDTPGGRREFVVRGLLEPAGVARVFGGRIALMDIGGAQLAFARPRFINRVDVVVRRDADVATVAAAVGRAVPPGLHVETPQQRKADLHAVIHSIQLVLWGAALIAVFMCWLIAYNRLATHFEARAWEGSVLRAVGVRRGGVWWELLKEALVLGVAGVAFGIPLGIALGHVLLPLIAEATAVNFKLLGQATELRVHAGSIAVAAAVGLGAAVLASIVPTWRVSRVAVADTLRRRGLPTRDRGAGAARLGPALVALGILAALGLERLTGALAWSLAVTGLIALGAVVAARPLLMLLRKPLDPVLERLAGPTGPFAWSAIVGNPRRTALTLGMVALGLGSVLWLTTLSHSFERTLVYAQAGAVRAELVVTSANVAAGWVPAPVDEALIGELAGVPGVVGVAGNALVEWSYGGTHVGLEAFDPVYYTDDRFGDWLLLDEREPRRIWAQVARGDGVVVSTNFVQKFGTRVGDTLSLATPSGEHSFQVLGVTMNFAAAAGTIQLSRPLYAARWLDHNVNRIWVRTDPGRPAAAVGDEIIRRLGGRYRLRLLSAAEMVDYWVAQIRRGFAGVRVLRFLVFLAMLAGLADTLAAGVVQRVRQLGVARAVGVRRWQLQRMVLVEGIVLSALGLLLGGAMGLALGALWIESTFPKLLGYVLHLHVPYEEIAVLATLTAM
jgi:putative ABC transport system permease protein